ncbi:gamma-glutamylaminecyclotransferase B-like protein, partial [Dinothrombium tinctorium]
MNEEKGMHFVFVYGTLKTNQPNHKYLMDESSGKAKLVCKARTKDKWPLVIASKYNIPYLLLEKGKGHQVFGEVYLVDETKFAFLDEFESYPAYYTRLKTPVEAVDYNNDLALNPWIYFLSKSAPKLLSLPMFECYDSLGAHGLTYVERFDRVTLDQYSPTNDVQMIS